MAKTAGPTRQQIETDIRKKQFAPIYLLMGEESFYIDRIADMILKNALTEEEKDFNLTTYYGADATMADVVLACRRYPMMAERQVVFLNEAQAAKTGQQLKWDQLQQYALKPTPTTVLVVCHKGGSLKAAALTKAIVQSGGVVFESAALREFNIDRAVSEYAGTVGCKLDPRAQAMLIDHIGFDLALLAKEIDKLRMTLPVGAVITPESVAENVGISKEYNNFELIAAISKRDKVKTFKIINYFRSNPKKNPTAPITSLIFNLFANVLIAYYARTTDERALMEALRMKTPYRTEIAAVGNVDKQQHGQLALLFVDLYEGLAAACGDIPVDVAYLVAVLIFAHFRECHTASFERGVVFSGEYVLRQTACLDFNLPDFS